MQNEAVASDCTLSSAPVTIAHCRVAQANGFYLKAQCTVFFPEVGRLSMTLEYKNDAPKEKSFIISDALPISKRKIKTSKIGLRW